MSNGRRPARSNTYRTGYLKSVAWFRRGDTWLDLEASRKGTLRCEVCRQPKTRGEIELHHLHYRGVQQVDAVWVATETHDELIALDSVCHEALHTLLDGDRVLRSHRTRAVATIQAIAGLQRRLTQTQARSASAHQQ